MNNESIHGFQLSPQQKHLWLLQDKHSLAYRSFCTVEITGNLNIETLKSALETAVKRHQILDTSFRSLPGMNIPLQVIENGGNFLIEKHDFTTIKPEEQKNAVELLIESAKQQMFDLEKSSSLQISLATLSASKYVLLLNLPALYADATSLNNLVGEISRTYTGHLHDDEPVQYIVFSDWQNELLESEEAEIGREYWRQKDITHIFNLKLPNENLLSGETQFQPQILTQIIPPHLAAEITASAKKCNTTESTVLLTCWQILLWRLTNISNMVIGTNCDGRSEEELQEMLGLLAKYVPVDCHLQGSFKLSEVLEQITFSQNQADEWQDCFNWELISGLDKAINDVPFFPFCFDFIEQDCKFLTTNAVTFSLLQQYVCFDKFKVKLSFIRTENSLHAEWYYDSELFLLEDIERLSGQFFTLLKSAINHPDALLSELEILSDNERKKLLIDFNNTQTVFPINKCFHQLFAEQVERTPDNIAIVYKNQQFTYRELNTRANQLAHYLQQLGVKPDVMVGLCVERSPLMLIALLGILKAGGAYIPIDPSYPLERKSFILNDSQMAVLLTQQHLIADLATNGIQVICIDSDFQAINQQKIENPITTTTELNLAYVIYTSGSTGKPKGTLIPHQGLVNYLIWATQRYAVEQGGGTLVHSPLGFDLTITSLLSPLLVGRTVELLSEEQGIETLSQALKKSSNLSLVKITPAHLDLLKQQLSKEEIVNKTRAFIIGGENLLAQSITFWQDVAPDTILVNEYGPTETVVGCCVYQVPVGKHSTGSIPIGKAIANTQLYILDQYLQPVPLGVPGELHIGGLGLARGYLNQAELTALKFIPNPFSKQENDRLYKTSDLARYLPSGDIEYIGRIDNQIKIRGFRVELGEIEAVINQHPAVRETVVVVSEESVNSKRIVAYVVPQKEQTLAIPELRSFLESKLPSYMVPTVFVTLETLPLTPNGKVDRKALPAPELTHVSSSNIVPPSTPFENLLAGIWAEVLALDKVGIDNNFFELGGHSLMSTRVMSQIRQVFQVELPLRCLFEKPTIAELAKEIEKAIKVDSGVEATNIERIGRSPQLPLSFAQQRLWFLAQLKPDSPLYSTPGAVRLQGKLNVEALQQSFNEIISRHEALRTNFQTTQGQAIAVISEEKPLMFSIFDISELSSDQQKAEIKQQTAQEEQQPFDLSSDYLLRVKLLRINTQEHILILTMHHIVSDGWSIGVLVQELATLYQAFCNEQPSPLSELPIQYVDFAAWQRQWLQGEVLETQISYWRKHLENAPKVLELPTDHPRPPIQTFRGATYSFELSEELSVAVNKLSQQQGSTLFMTLLAAFQTLLWRYTEQEDIVVGSPIANRNRAEIEGLIGFFVNTLVLRTNLAGNPSFQELLKRVREVALGAYAHQDLPFELLVEQLQPQRDLSHTPLFQVMFVLQNAPISALEFPGLTLSRLESSSDSAKFDLTLFMTEIESGLVGSLEYNTDLFEENTICRMAGHLQILLEAIVANPQQRLSELGLLSESERHQLLVEWNNTEVEYLQKQCIHELFEAQVERTPDAVAVIFESEQLTYCELNTKANQLAHYLGSLGVKPEVLVGICVERSLSMIIGLLAILKAGGAYVPLDPSYPQERLAYMLEDSQPGVLLTQQYLLKSLPNHKAQVICIDGDWKQIANESTANPVSNITCDNLAYVIYTSGSTGKPKGAMNTHSGICNRLLWMQDIYQLTSADAVLQKTPFSFDVSVWEFFWTLMTGARLVVAQPEGHRDTKYLVNLILQQQITTLHFVPSMLQVFIEAEGLEKCQSLVRVIASGEALTAQLQKRFFNRLDTQLHNLYGPTEAAVDVTFWQCQKDSVTNQNTVSIGQPIANIHIYLLDKYLNPIPMGVTGEVYISGVGLGRGYLNRPDLTAEKFIPNPFSKQTERLYKTGDKGRYLSNGEIEYIGRIDHQVKVRGFRIELGEIEAIISQYPVVRETVVIVSEESVNSKRLVAYVVPQNEQRLAISEVRCFLESKLPNYMVPSAFVTLEALPLTPNGKIDRKALPVPDLTQISSSNIVPPCTPIENLLAGIWAEVLGLDKVGINNNFFELGGHSLIATRVISQIRQVFQVELPLHYLFEKPTIAGLAKEIEKAIKVDSGIESTKIERIGRSPQLPLSFAQQRLWFLAQLEADSPFYNIPAAVRLQGELNFKALQQSFDEIISRHEALRTNFQSVEGQAVAVIKETKPLVIPLLDLSELTSEQQELEIRQQASQEAQQPFDISSDHLLRVKLLRLGEQEHIVLLTMHHIVSDGWSTGVLVQELATLYPAFFSGQASPLPELPIQYVDFAAWQRQWLQGEVLETQLSYWLKQLENAPKVLELPTDHPRPAIQTFRGATYSFELSKELSASLNKLSQQQGSTLFITLLAAFQTLLWRYTGQEDIVVGSPIANRNRAEIEGLIGFFVNTLVLRTNLAGNPSFEELLKRVRQLALGAYAHQDLPFELLVEQLQPQRDLSHTPLFQVMFVLQNAPMSALELPGLTLSPLESDSNTSKFDLTLYMSETESELVGNLEYNTDLFKEISIHRMVENLQTLLFGIVANPKQCLSELPLLSESEKHQLLEEWNDTQVEYPQQLCIHELFEAQVQKTPDAVTVVFEDEQLTYRELNIRANQLAHYLQQLGVKPEVLVGIYVERSLYMIIGLLAILKAGGAYVPLDPRYPQERLAFILEDVQLAVLLTQGSLAEAMPQHKAQVVSLDTDWHLIEQQTQENLFSQLTPDNLAYTIYTSGSTGKPKGVQIPHIALSNFLLAMKQSPGVTKKDTLLAVTTYSFDIAVLELFLPIIVGGRLVIISRQVALDGTQLSATLTDSKATVMQATPATWQLLLAAGWGGNHQLKILCGGEALSAHLANQLRQQCHSLWNMYGPTETTIWSAASLVKTLNSNTVPISYPIANTQLYILDQYNQLVPVGTIGELCIAGEGLARGYFHRPDLTAEKFIPNPFSDKSARLYKTGDKARYLPNGEIEYLGRIDNQVKLRGFRIELGEIEVVITQHSGVQATVVVLVDGQSLVAYVVPQKEQILAITELRSFLESKLPTYMMPAAFVILEALPLTPNGKVDRKALPAPDTARPQLEAIYQPPQTEVEQAIADIWKKILNVENVGIYDNFFEMGGHSLLLVQVHRKLLQAFKSKVSIIDLFRYPTISSLADYLNQVKNGKLSSGVVDVVTEKIADGKAQQRKRLQKMKSIENS
ncbi:amino acid adenylation domain-containing protein [Nostoc sp. CCCryo 231-06]|nr:amino acid adenylation domain-containing protein [Nostoc sp. CCCryo 231-06]